MSQAQKAKDEWKYIDTWLGATPNEKIGGALTQYVIGSNHSGWDGFKPSDLIGVRRFLLDLILYERTNLNG